MILTVLGIVIMGTSTASLTLKQETSPIIQADGENSGSISFSPTDHPEWAEGGFVGTWGKGKNDVLGYFKGIYGHKGRVPIFLGAWNTSNGDKIGSAQGIFAKGYILGKMDREDDKTAHQFIGLYKATKTKFIARVMGPKGLPVIVAGTFKPFEK